MAGLVGYSSSDDGSDESQKKPYTETLNKSDDRTVNAEKPMQDGQRIEVSTGGSAEARSNGPGSRPEGQWELEGQAGEERAGQVGEDNTRSRNEPTAVGPQRLPPPQAEGVHDILIGPSRPSQALGSSINTTTAAYEKAGSLGGDGESEGEGEGEGDQPPLSPYSAERAAIREATLPRLPDFNIPSSPPGTPPPSLEVLGSKIDMFLTLKRDKGVHFNARLATSDAMKSPALMDKLISFVGCGEGGGVKDSEDEAEGTTRAQYRTTLPSHVWDPTAFPEWARRKPLRALQDELAKQRARGLGERVDFVPATTAAAASAESAGPSRGATVKRKTRL